MFSQVTLFLFACFLSSSATSLVIYKNAQFVPINVNVKLTDLGSISSRNDCVCKCLANSQCVTATYVGINQSCSLFSAYVRQNWLQLVTTMLDASVLTFGNVKPSVCSTFAFQQPATLYTTGLQPQSVISADFNKDGHSDLVITNYGANTVSTLLGIGNGSFRLPAVSFASNGNNPSALVTEDFNGDGNFDLAICNEISNNIAVFLGRGNGSFQLPAMTFASGGTLPSSITAIDVNNDNKIDVIVTNTLSNTITSLYGMGNGSFQVPGQSYTAGVGTSFITNGDFNADGNIDLAVVSHHSNQLLIFIGYHNGTFQSNPTSYTTGDYPEAVRTADFNGDAKLDLVVVNSNANTISIFIGTGTGTFVAASPTTYSTVGANPIDVAVQDMNGDSVIDLVVSNQGGNNIIMYLGAGNGTFGPGITYSSGGTSLQSIIAQDFNEDGRYDLSVVNQNSNTVAILLTQCT